MANAPNTAWVTNISYIETEGDWVYLADVKDVFNGELVDHNLMAEVPAKH